MKIIVFADSHTDVSTMLAVAEMERPDAVLHLGDHIADGLALRDRIDTPIYLVKGNADEASADREETFLSFDNVRVYMTHGHQYDVENTLTGLFRAGARFGADIVLFGHTHKPYLSYTDGVWYMNPGRIGRRSSKIIRATYGVIRLLGNRIGCEISEVGL